MKLASLKEGGRDGTLVVVSDDLTRAVKVPEIATTLQAALDNWDSAEPALRDISKQLHQDKCPHAFPLIMRQLASPLPRAYQWLDGSAYVNHVELVRKSRGVEMPPSFWEDPLMYQGGSDSFLAPHDPIEMTDVAWGIDFEAEVAVITDDVPMGIGAGQAGGHIKLLMLVNDVSLRNLAPNELVKGFGFLQCKPATAFSPIAVTPDVLGKAWKDTKLHLPLVSHYNGKLFGKPNAGTDMTFNFAKLISHAAKTRFLGAGTIIGSGTVSNYDRSLGSSCIVEKRMLEALEHGKASTPFLHYGDSVRIEMFDGQGQSIFGAIEQEVMRYGVAAL